VIQICNRQDLAAQGIVKIGAAPKLASLFAKP